MFGNLLGYFVACNFSIKNALVPFLGNYWQIWVTFLVTLSVTRRPDDFSNIWPLIEVKVCPMSKLLLPKTYHVLPKWRNFAKSGHTAMFKHLGTSFKLTKIL